MKRKLKTASLFSFHLEQLSWIVSERDHLFLFAERNIWKYRKYVKRHSSLPKSSVQSVLQTMSRNIIPQKIHSLTINLIVSKKNNKTNHLKQYELYNFIIIKWTLTRCSPVCIVFILFWRLNSRSADTLERTHHQLDRGGNYSYKLHNLSKWRTGCRFFPSLLKKNGQ